MRRTSIAAAAAALAAFTGLAAPAHAATVPDQIDQESCFLQVNHGTRSCLVVLFANTSGIFDQYVYSGFSTLKLHCQVSGDRYWEGGPGSDYGDWSHSYDVCTMTLTNYDGYSEAYVD